MLFGKNRSIVWRITLWYSLFLVGLIAFLLFMSFNLTQRFVDQGRYRSLVQTADQLAKGTIDLDDVEEDYEVAVYNAQNQLVEGKLPKGFSASHQPQFNQVQQVQSHKRTYLVTDRKLSNQSWIRLALAGGRVRRDYSAFGQMLLIVGPIVIMLGLGGGYWLLKRAFAPVERMSETAASIIANGDLSQRIALQNQGDELTQLAQLFNQLLARVEGTLEREKQLTNDLSHEMRTPLATILAESEYGLRYADSPEESRESFQVIVGESQRMNRLINQMLELARNEEQKVDLEALNLTDLVQGRLASYEILAEEANLQLVSSLEEQAWIRGNALLLERLVDNLLSNALKYAQEQVRVRLGSESDGIVLAVQNDGPLIPLEEQEKIWYRFYQLDAARNSKQVSGAGLGLTFVQQIATLHGASVQLESTAQVPTTFCVQFEKLKDF